MLSCGIPSGQFPLLSFIIVEDARGTVILGVLWTEDFKNNLKEILYNFALIVLKHCYSKGLQFGFSCLFMEGKYIS